MDDFVTDDYDATSEEGVVRGQWRHIIAPVAAALITIAVCITFILTCLATPKVRRDTSKWLQVLVAFFVLISGILDTFFQSAHETRANEIWKLKGFCKFLLPLHQSFYLLIPLGLVAVSLERLVSLWKGKEKGSSFTKKTTLVVGIILVVVCVVSSYIIHGVQGEVEVKIVDDARWCEASTEQRDILHHSEEAGFILLVLVTIILVVKFIKVRHCDGETYPPDRILPFIFGNLVEIVQVLLSMVIADLLFKFFSMDNLGELIVLLIWLLGQSDTRAALRTACCPYLTEKKDGDAEWPKVVRQNSLTITWASLRLK